MLQKILELKTMVINEQTITQSLQALIDPNTGRDFVTSKSVKNIKIDGDNVSLDIVLGYPAKSQFDTLKSLVIKQLMRIDQIGSITVNIGSRIVTHSAQRGVNLLPNVKNIIAVASGKGGVGKSTTSVNLALALAAEGATVGILDADIYGPSQPQMLGISGRPESADGKSMDPMMGHGIQAMSIGFLVDVDSDDILIRRRRRDLNACSDRSRRSRGRKARGVNAGPSHRSRRLSGYFRPRGNADS